MAAKTEPEDFQIELFWSARRNFYQLIRLLFLEPDFKNLREISSFANLDELAQFHEGGNILRAFFDRLTAEQVKKEQEEFQRLFIGPGPLITPPWESYYRSKEHLLFEEWTYQVRRLYHQCGLQYVKENNEPDDHLLLELEFMYYLADLSRSEKDLHKSLELISIQIAFLKEHLAIWIPSFCKKLIEATNSQLFLGAAMLLEDFLSEDLNSLYEVREAITNG
ncbi:molecular chaperone [Bacillus sp. FJAT-29814]|uniref:TorD/DmsD family molecular chaperone n=1 Tax=Bacillus sp. FJAT-29814 TaxID=1729688 RepID=UPI000834E8F8|nr:molecular chaperone TorD family protein [Bacillus sp. FJAT-29814]